MTPRRRLLRTSQAAALLGVTARTIDRWCASGRLEAHMTAGGEHGPGQWRIAPSAVEAFKQARKTATADDRTARWRVRFEIRSLDDPLFRGRKPRGRVAFGSVLAGEEPWESLMLGCAPDELETARTVAEARRAEIIRARRTKRPPRFGTRAHYREETGVARAVLAGLGWHLTYEEQFLLDEAAGRE